ncbi:phospholipase A2-like [Diabrotica virgifera virgifera]|uniref:phospholipase A2 n=1 Tax=Diabrotica virgifera virgifera TaxID=50390 RepID=A0ABM5L2R9_DIAVI|nr:phospholipase A2-like [Diabrotica virgifera virgifera]
MDNISDGNYVFAFDDKHIYSILGTKWCGVGNIAENYDDLGEEEETDKCCRAHDNCPDIIKAFNRKHGLFNSAFYTRVHCDCDAEFYDCLEAAGTASSKEVSSIYFKVLHTQCFKKDYTVLSCTKITVYGCEEYELDETKEKEYQWFDVTAF